MIDEIDYMEDKSFLSLDWRPGEVIGLNNDDHEMPSPFILAIPEKITRGFDKSGLRFIFHHPKDGGEREEWTLHPKGYMLGLWTADYIPNKRTLSSILSGEQTKFEFKPNFEIIKDGLPHGNAYFAERAYSGKKAIEKAFSQDPQMIQYHKWIKDGIIAVERGSLDGLFERLGLGVLLPPQLMVYEYAPKAVVCPKGVQRVYLRD